MSWLPFLCHFFQAPIFRVYGVEHTQNLFFSLNCSRQKSHARGGERMTTTTNSRRMNARTMVFSAVVSSSLLFLSILDLATTIGVNAQKELAFEHHENPLTLGKTTTRTPETITTEDDDDTKNTDAYGSKRGGEWTFATPASKGLSQSSLEVRSFFLYLSLFWNH